MCASITSSPPPEKPPDCSSEAWSVLAEVVNSMDDENVTPITQENNIVNRGTTNKPIIIELTNVDANGLEETIIMENLVGGTLPLPEDSFIIVKDVNANDLNSLDEAENLYNQETILERFNQDVQEIVDESNLEDGVNKKEKKLSRKRVRNPRDWKQNMRKSKRQRGEEYINVKGSTVSKKTVKEKMCKSSKCAFKCSIKIQKEERELIHKTFWSLSDSKKLYFYSKHIKRHLAVRKRTAKENSKKIYSYKYFFIVCGITVRVCQEYFLNTLNISKQRIYYFFKKCQDQSTEVPVSPLQGKHKKKCISEDKKDEVRAHIKSFPPVESHYCRASTKKLYLERNLNLKRMYELYAPTTRDPVKFNIYEQIFKTEFNISFYKPKKDICDKCAEYKMLKNPTEVEIKKQDQHINRKDIGNHERANDRGRYANNASIGVVTFDLQNTFALPKSNVSKNFYKMKLSCYNLTAHLNVSNTIYNAIWHEFAAGRAGIHIASGLIRILKAIIEDNPELRKLIIWSDSCEPQNKNSIMSFALQWFLQSDHGKNIETIEQKFGEPGHGNVQEIDNAHSCIERHLRNQEIWSPLTLLRLILTIPKTWKLKFKVLQMRPQDYLNYQSSAARFSYNKIPYTKVKHLIYEKATLLKIKYRQAFEGPVTTVTLTYPRRINRHEEVRLPESVPQVETKAVVIQDQKKKHLLEMLPQMPEEEREFYYAVLKVKKGSKQ